jgi:hypothetical protein
MRSGYGRHLKGASSLGGYLFLLGCMTLPFFNDFPLLSTIALSFRDLSTVFFLLSGAAFILESMLARPNIKVDCSNLFFVVCLLLLIWINVLWNLSKSGAICGDQICGLERMVGVGSSTSIRLGLLLVFMHYVKTEGMYQISKFVRVGFYLSLLYVTLELVNSYIPYYLGNPTLGFLEPFEAYFHLRENDYGANRTRGLAFEPGYQAIFLIVCLPFLLADDSTGRRTRNIIAWLICLISSASPAGVMAALVYYLTYKLRWQKLLAVAGVLAICIALFVYIIFANDYIEYFDVYGTGFVSTITRSASWVAGSYAILDNFAFGVGPGMSGYWVTDYYPEFFSNSNEMQSWYELGQAHFEAPTFASLITFVLDYGVVLCLIIIGYLIKNGILQATFRSRIGRASTLALLTASFSLSGYLVWGYWLFFSITLSRSWDQLNASAVDTISAHSGVMLNAQTK